MSASSAPIRAIGFVFSNHVLAPPPSRDVSHPPSVGFVLQNRVRTRPTACPRSVNNPTSLGFVLQNHPRVAPPRRQTPKMRQNPPRPYWLRFFNPTTPHAGQ